MVGVDLKRMEAELHGKTLLTYWHLLKRGGPAGVRETQRALGFSSPSVALYHLEKLRELGLASKDEEGQYYLVEEVKVGVLKFFIRLGGFMLPRYLFYAVFMSTLLASYLAIYGLSGCIHNLFAISFGFIASLILWIEAIRIWLQKPF